MGEEAVESGLELQQRIAASLRALPEPYRTAIYLRFYRDLGPSRIATESGVPLETVRTRLRRGLELLRSDLDARHGGKRELWCSALVGLLEARPVAPLPVGTVGPDIAQVTPSDVPFSTQPAVLPAATNDVSAGRG